MRRKDLRAEISAKHTSGTSGSGKESEAFKFLFEPTEISWFLAVWKNVWLKWNTLVVFNCRILLPVHVGWTSMFFFFDNIFWPTASPPWSIYLHKHTHAHTHLWCTPGTDKPSQQDCMVAVARAFQKHYIRRVFIASVPDSVSFWKISRAFLKSDRDESQWICVSAACPVRFSSSADSSDASFLQSSSSLAITTITCPTSLTLKTNQLFSCYVMFIVHRFWRKNLCLVLSKLDSCNGSDKSCIHLWAISYCRLSRESLSSGAKEKKKRKEKNRLFSPGFEPKIRHRISELFWGLRRCCAWNHQTSQSLLSVWTRTLCSERSDGAETRWNADNAPITTNGVQRSSR